MTPEEKLLQAIEDPAGYWERRANEDEALLTEIRDIVYFGGGPFGLGARRAVVYLFEQDPERWRP